MAAITVLTPWSILSFRRDGKLPVAGCFFSQIDVICVKAEN
jgi:hypothetical protein